MLNYLLKRLGILGLTLFVVSLLAFGLSKLAPGDPVERLPQSELGNLQQKKESYRRAAKMLGLDKPAFYFSVHPAAYPDTLYRFINYYERQTLKNLVGQYGNWEKIEAYWKEIYVMERQIEALPDSLDRNSIIKLRTNTTDLFVFYKDNRIQAALERMQKALENEALANAIKPAFERLKQKYELIITQPETYRLYLPSFSWYGFDNQYHNWFWNFIRGDFGYSLENGQKIEEKMWSRLRWTLLINGITLFLVFLLAIPIGVYTSVYQNTMADRLTTLGLFMLYSLPSFWVATMLIVFFTTPEYGMNWFPTYGLGNLSEDASWWQLFLDRAYHLILPIFCLTYGSLAFVARQMRGGMIDVSHQDYIRTARAKGLSERVVIWKHSFRNALFPIITLVASIFPAVLSGSVVIEVIFSIPGMGKLTIDAIYAKDWPVVFAILMLSAFMTMIGILVADLLYALADPRVSFQKKNQ